MQGHMLLFRAALVRSRDVRADPDIRRSKPDRDRSQPDAVGKARLHGQSTPARHHTP